MVAELVTPAGVGPRPWPGHSESGEVHVLSFDGLDDVDVDGLLDMAESAGPGLEGLEILLVVQQRSRSVGQSLRLGALLAGVSNWLSGQEALALAEAVSLAADDDRSDRQYGHRAVVDPERLVVEGYSLRTARTAKHVQALLDVGCLGLTDQSYNRVLESGVVDEVKAKVICRAVDGLTLPDQDPDEVDGATLAKWRHDVITLGARLAKRHHWQRMERELAKFTDQLRPHGLTDRHRREYAKRHVALIPRPAAMAELRVYGAYSELGQVYATLTKLALDTRQTNKAAARATGPAGAAGSGHGPGQLGADGPGPTGCGGGGFDVGDSNSFQSGLVEQTVQSLNQLRYDELIAALIPAASPAEASKRATRLAGAAARPHLLVAVNASTLIGLDDNPAMVLGGPALPGGVARRLAACSTWQQLLTDPASQRVISIGERILPPGEVFEPDDDPGGGGIDDDGGGTAASWHLPEPGAWPSEALSSNSYTPSPRLKRLIAVRDQTCRIPTCSQPAWRCEIDHVEEFDPADPAPEQTVASNLELLCKSHHELKTKHQWDITRNPTTGQTTIITNLGYTTTIPPATIYPNCR